MPFARDSAWPDFSAVLVAVVIAQVFVSKCRALRPDMSLAHTSEAKICYNSRFFQGIAHAFRAMARSEFVPVQKYCGLQVKEGVAATVGRW